MVSRAGFPIQVARSNFHTTIGGSGITFGTSNLIAIIDAARRGESAVRRVKLVWMMRDKGM